MRRDWGIVSNDYNSLVGAATYRRGLSSSLTVEAHAEADPGSVMAGAGAVFGVGNLAPIPFTLAGKDCRLPV